MTPTVTMPALFAIGLGAVLGAWCRWLLQVWLAPAGNGFAWGTLVANLAGGLLIGVALAWLMRHPDLHPLWRLGLVTGFLGALTTFSTFSAESLQLLQRGEVLLAIGHSLAHVAGCLAAAAIGFWLASPASH